MNRGVGTQGKAEQGSRTAVLRGVGRLVVTAAREQAVQWCAEESRGGWESSNLGGDGALFLSRGFYSEECFLPALVLAGVQ